MLQPFTDAVQWKRSERQTVIQGWAQRYADHLAGRCLQAPQQWFNFYPFWNDHDNTAA